MEKIRVLLFAANPLGTTPLDLPREFREIEEEVSRGTFRDVMELILVPSTRPVDLIRKLNENHPRSSISAVTATRTRSSSSPGKRPTRPIDPAAPHDRRMIGT
jgi:hypothetical protein